MEEIPPNGGRFLCILDDCGEYVDLRGAGRTPLSKAELDMARAGKPVQANPAAAPPPARKQSAEEPADAARKDVLELLEKHKVYGWQFEAIAQAYNEVRDDPAVWQREEWDFVRRALRADTPAFVKKALQALREKLPAEEYRVRHLRGLLTREGVNLLLRTEGEEAAQSGWHDAVEGMIARLEGDRPQVEAGLGGKD